MAINLQGSDTSTYSSSLDVSGTWPSDKSNQIRDGGYYGRNDTGSATAFEIYSGGTDAASRKIKFTTGGSATFGSDVTANGTFVSDRGTTDSASFQAKKDGNVNAEISSAGRATFFGDLFVKSNDNEFAEIEPAGVLKLQSNNASMASADAIRVTNATADSARISYDGSSQFLGQLQISTASVGGISEKVLLHEQGWIRTYNATSTAGANLYLGFSDVNGAGTAAFFVTANGVVSARNTAISQIGSERRLKNTIEPLDPVTSWETIRDLPYYSYKLNGNDDTTYYGPIVDECPEEMIVEGATSDEQGNIRTYDNSLLQSRLFVALQTALTRIEALEAKVQQLEGGNQ